MRRSVNEYESDSDDENPFYFEPALGVGSKYLEIKE